MGTNIIHKRNRNKDEMVELFRQFLNRLFIYIKNEGISAKVNNKKYKSSAQIHNFNPTTTNCEFKSIKGSRYYLYIEIFSGNGDEVIKIININFSSKIEINSSWYNISTSSSINISIPLSSLNYISSENFKKNTNYFFENLSKNKLKRLNKMLNVYEKEDITDSNLNYIFTQLKRNLNVRFDQYEIISAGKLLSKSEKRHNRLSQIIKKTKKVKLS